MWPSSTYVSELSHSRSVQVCTGVYSQIQGKLEYPSGGSEHQGQGTEDDLVTLLLERNGLNTGVHVGSVSNSEK